MARIGRSSFIGRKAAVSLRMSEAFERAPRDHVKKETRISQISQMGMNLSALSAKPLAFSVKESTSNMNRPLLYRQGRFFNGFRQRRVGVEGSR